jgi:hypothetical protein
MTACKKVLFIPDMGDDMLSRFNFCYRVTKRLPMCIKTVSRLVLEKEF